MQDSFSIQPTDIYPLGTYFTKEGLHISGVFTGNEECGIILYDKNHKDGVQVKIPECYRVGNIYSCLLKGYTDKSFSYLFFQGNRIFQDPYAKALEGKREYGKTVDFVQRCRTLSLQSEWDKNKPLNIPYSKSIFYMLHVRGFTKHKSSNVKAKGTFRGIVEKIPYLKELGITGIILMPAYEFDEIIKKQKKITMEETIKSFKEPIDISEENCSKINYWGYKEGLYYMPKNAYAFSKDSCKEFQEMVASIHKEGIEVIMQFFFPDNMRITDMTDILRHWVVNYHIDGFQLLGSRIIPEELQRDPLLSETKILCDKDCTVEADKVSSNFGHMNESFLYDMRRLLKGDANLINTLIYYMKQKPVVKGSINYIAKQEGFRLADLVSYDYKHNEDNGEDNRDGNPFNESWNCGIEGKTRKKPVLALRERQMKNALVLVMFSLGTPLLYSGDEFGCTQNGNNNPYCQDNIISWINWADQKRNASLLKFTKELIKLRRELPLFEKMTSFTGTDKTGCGYPDISFHGKEAWRPDVTPSSRSLGIMYCDGYSKQKKSTDAKFLYLGMNFHWEGKMLALPALPKNWKWELSISTEKEISDNAAELNEKGVAQDCMCLPARTIMLYKAVNNKNIERD